MVRRVKAFKSILAGNEALLPFHYVLLALDIVQCLVLGENWIHKARKNKRLGELDDFVLG
jgi:hypothetical protein